jgi:hypothetical protein
VSTTTVTTEPPPVTVADAVRRRIQYLHGRGVRRFTTDHFAYVPAQTGRPLSWVTDHLLVLEGIGSLQPVPRTAVRTWSVRPGSDLLR